VNFLTRYLTYFHHWLELTREEKKPGRLIILVRGVVPTPNS